VIEEVYLMSKNNPPHGLQLRDDRVFDHNVGYEVSNNLSVIEDVDWMLTFGPFRLRRDSTSRHLRYTDFRNP